MKKKSAFLNWFVAQHGERQPVGSESDSDLETIITAGKRAARTLAQRREWDARSQSALYAWVARDVKPPH